MLLPVLLLTLIYLSCILNWIELFFYHLYPFLVHHDIIVGDTPVEFTSPGYPLNYPGNNTFFPYTFSTSDPSKHIQFEFSVFQLGGLSYLAFGTGHVYFNASSFVAVFHAWVPPTTFYAPSNRVWADFYTGYMDDEGFSATVSTYPAGREYFLSPIYSYCCGDRSTIPCSYYAYSTHMHI